MSEIDGLVERLARAYLAVRGSDFEHLGVRLPLDQKVLALAIQNNIVGALLEHAGGKQGWNDAVLLLRQMVGGNALTPLGCQVLDEMNRAFCAEVRQMLDEGKDLTVELSKEISGRATQ